MKNLLNLLSCLILSTSMAFAQDYTMFLTIELDPIPGKAGALEKGVKAHNAKFHKDGSNKGYLWSILSGPRSGKYVWGQGPMTWGDMDTPLTEEHGADWDKNVGANCKNVSNYSYFKRDDKRTYNPDNQITAKQFVAKVFTITGNREAILDALGEIAEVFRAKKYPQARRVYTSELNLKSRQEVALIYPFKSFKMFETSTGLPAGFTKTFEEINGFGSWQRLVVGPIQANSEGFFDEIRVLIE